MVLVLGDREMQLGRLSRSRFDVAIVGGGISGAGSALELSARGRRVALLERSDFAAELRQYGLPEWHEGEVERVRG